MILRRLIFIEEGETLCRRLWQSQAGLRQFGSCHSSHPVVDCLNELTFTRQSRLESVLEVENDVMLVQVFRHIA